MSDHAANSSDLELARALSGKVCGQHHSQDSLSASTSGSFARFASRETAPPTPEPRVDPAHATPRSFESWDDLVAWIKRITSCQVVFVVDPESFVIAQHGHHSLEELEGIGAQFQDVAERATEIEIGAARALALQLESGWLSGIRFPREESGYFLVGVIADEVLPREIQAAISAQVEFNLDRL